MILTLLLYLHFCRCQEGQIEDLTFKFFMFFVVLFPHHISMYYCILFDGGGGECQTQTFLMSVGRTLEMINPNLPLGSWNSFLRMLMSKVERLFWKCNITFQRLFTYLIQVLYQIGKCCLCIYICVFILLLIILYFLFCVNTFCEFLISSLHHYYSLLGKG